MNTRRRPCNQVQLSKIFFALFFAITVGAAGGCYLSLKNTQHNLGERVRQTERELRELRSRNQDYQSRIARLSSRMALRRHVDTGFVALTPVQATAIARLAPATMATNDGVLRTAANHLQRP
ncbi:MAG: hypothetical protein WA771_14445 [Chthoniobacterales bacterium]